MGGILGASDQHTLLIPVLVTGIQPTQVCAAGRVLSAQGLGLTGFL
jgi:hypothetical protein